MTGPPVFGLLVDAGEPWELVESVAFVVVVVVVAFGLPQKKDKGDLNIAHKQRKRNWELVG